MGDSEAANIAGGEPAVEIHFHIRQLVKLGDAVVADANPRGKAGKRGLPQQSPAELGSRLGKQNRVPSLPESPRTLQPRRPAPDHQHRFIRSLRPDALGVPAPTMLFTHGGVLGATNRHLRVVAGDADIAADALANVVRIAARDLGGQKRIGEWRAGPPR